MSAFELAMVDPAPMVGVSQAQAEAAARVVAAMCPGDVVAVLSALGLLRDGRICAPPAPHGAVLLALSLLDPS